MLRGIDHVVILVDDLDQASDRYRDLGFTVTPGGKHPRGTHNTLIPFADGSYLELIAFWERDEEHVFHKYLATGPGAITFALLAEGLEDGLAALAERGLNVNGPLAGARSRPDGVEIAWTMAVLDDNTNDSLPFLIDDVTDRGLRVPGGDAASHANGITGISRLIVATDDLDRSARRYTQLLGAEPVSSEPSPSIGPATAAVFQVGEHLIELAQPAGEGPLARHVQRRGASPYELVFRAGESAPAFPEEVLGTRLRVQQGA